MWPLSSRKDTDPKFILHQWFDFFLVKSVNTNRPNQMLFGFDDFLGETAIFGLKIDTSLPYPALGKCWIDIPIQDRKPISYPCSAFDREYLQFEERTTEADVKETVLKSGQPLFKLGLLRRSAELIKVALRVPEHCSNHVMTITLICGRSELLVGEG